MLLPNKLVPGVDAAAAGVDAPNIPPPLGTGVDGVAPNKLVLVAGAPKALGVLAPNAFPVLAGAPNIPGVAGFAAPNVLDGVVLEPNVPNVLVGVAPKAEGVCGAPNALPGFGDGANVEPGDDAMGDPVIVPP